MPSTFYALPPAMSDNNQAEITAVGIGSAGSRIVSLLSRRSLLIDRFAYVSCDRGDFSFVDSDETTLIESPVDQKLTPSMVRGLATRSLSKIEAAVSGSKVVFVVAGLGGATGSGLAPLVAAIARDTGATTVGVAVMPFEFEKKMKFYAGVALKRLREASRSVIVIDNHTLMRGAPDDSTLTAVYDTANKEAVKALGSLLSKTTGTSVPVGLNKILGTVLQDGYSLLGVSNSGSFDKAEEALARGRRGLGGRYYETRKQVEARVAQILVPALEGLLVVEAGTRTGKPTLSWHRDEETIAAAAHTDGVYALATNLPGRLSATNVLRLYKEQSLVERRHRDLKSTLRVRPIFLHNDDRIEALVSIVGLALLVFGLIEADLRRALAPEEELPGLLPEGRAARPTGRSILAAFQGLGLTYTREGIVLDRLTHTQRRILELLRAPIPWPEQGRVGLPNRGKRG